jgi:hypothetical protein
MCDATRPLAVAVVKPVFDRFVSAIGEILSVAASVGDAFEPHIADQHGVRVGKPPDLPAHDAPPCRFGDAAPCS